MEVKQTINKIQYEFITVEWIEEQLRIINVTNAEEWNENTTDVIAIYLHNFAILIYNLFQRGLGHAVSKNGEFVLGGFDFNKYEINEGKSLNKTDLEGAKEKIYKILNTHSGDIEALKKALQELITLVNQIVSNLSDLTDEVGLLNSSIAELTETVETHTTEIEGLTTAMEGLVTVIDELTDEVALLNSTVAGQQIEIDDLQTQINDNKVGAIRAYNLVGLSVPLPTSCDTSIWVLKFGCKDGIVGTYWQLEKCIIKS